MSYIFSAARPPLLKDFDGDILSVPLENLTSNIGKKVFWTEPGVLGANGLVNTRTITVQRKLIWSLTELPVHYATDHEIEYKYSTGYSKTSKESVVKTIGGKAGGKFFGLELSVAADLKLTTDFSEEWHEEKTVTVKVKYEAGNTYCTWRLNDSIEVSVSTASANTATPPEITTTVIEDRIISIVRIYQDIAADTASNLLNNFSKSNSHSLLLTNFDGKEFLLPLLDSDKNKESKISLKSLDCDEDGNYEVVFEVETLGCERSTVPHFSVTLVFEDGHDLDTNIVGWSSGETGSSTWDLKRKGKAASKIVDIVNIEQADFICFDE